ncbi:NAD-binding protein [Oxalobacteraceae bacterium R-40]|uniref:NAD-binding protein n=1 Tax=Keguizhuia sedimenti TaxID=3064264 RepID=A0ABU1BSX6_9BURK|nr:NAD-binding protein [Oxalobacteraceae bacterium R-40]
MNSVFFIVLRRMRAPLILLIMVYCVSVVGLTLIPGVDADGSRATPMSFFHAFYFISYTATTIGFGEIPQAFSDGQRMWTTLCIYLTVVAWSYSILTLLALLQDKAFLQTLLAARFAGRVRRIRTPFYLVCGCGDTGTLICRALDYLGIDFVILDKDAHRIEELDLEEFKPNDPSLAADACHSATLLMAGLRHPYCKGVLAVTNDEDANLAIAINARLLNPRIPVLARARTPVVASNMAAFGTDHIVNAYERFAEYLALAVAAPERYRLIEILTGLPGANLPEVHRPPRGKWIICGFGDFGRAIARYLEMPGIEMTIIDPQVERSENGNIVAGRGTEELVLQEAGIEQAAGIVAGTKDDIINLAIATMAKRLRPDIFVVARQNHEASDLLFDTFRADFSMVHTRLVAQECISILTTPLLARFLAAVRGMQEEWCNQLAQDLEALCEGVVPEVWDVVINQHSAPAVHQTLQRKSTVQIAHLLRDNADRDTRLPVAVLMVERGGAQQLLPDESFELMPGDALLIAGQHAARSLLNLTLQNLNALEFILTGCDQRSGWLWRRLFLRQTPQALDIGHKN